MTIGRALAVLLGVAVLLGAVGTAIGYGLGRFNPGYYRAIFAHGHNPEFDPVEVGVGLGLTQGTAGGVVVGLALVALLCWRDTRLQRNSSATQASLRGTRSWQLLLVTGFLFGLTVSCAGGCAIGTALGDLW